jgi:copper(I)-binding protein
MHWIATSLMVAATILATRAVADDAPGGPVSLSGAWTPATSQAHGDTPLYMTITNQADGPDSLIRVRCPTDIADFTVKHTTDHGEGAPSMREVKSFVIPSKGTVVLAPEGNHLMLLQVREPMQEGKTFTCSIVFQNAGPVTVEVKVAPGEAKRAP